MASDRGLERVLDLRKKAEDAAQTKWSQSLAAVASCQAQIDKLAQFRALYLKEMEQKSVSVLSMNQYLAYEDFINRLDDAARRQAQVLDGLKQRSEQCREEFIKARQQRKIIESLIDSHRKKRLAEEARAEAKLSDDTVSSKMARIMQARKEGREP
ncbi:MAG: flagellar export protein FliJ [Succinivibrio sp.]